MQLAIIAPGLSQNGLYAGFMQVLPLLLAVSGQATGALLIIEVPGRCTAIDLMIAGRHGYRLFVSRDKGLRSIRLDGDALDTLRTRLSIALEVDPAYVRDVDQLDRFVIPS